VTFNFSRILLTLCTLGAIALAAAWVYVVFFEA
jgi:hypothetical protein